MDTGGDSAPTQAGSDVQQDQLVATTTTAPTVTAVERSEVQAQQEPPAAAVR